LLKLAFLINNYYPFGGMEKNFLRIVKACVKAQFEVQIFTMSWQGEQPEDAEVILVPFKGLSNHSRGQSFVDSFQDGFAPASFDLIVGFNRMPGLDLYYNADVCYVLDVARRRSFLSRLTSRYRTYSKFEEAVFGAQSSTHIMYLSEAEKKNYQQVYSTPESHFHYLPPGIDRQRIRTAQTDDIRQQVRAEFGLCGDDFLLLLIGSDFGRKGVARAISSVASLPDSLRAKAQLFIIGQGKEKKYRRQAQSVGLVKQVHFLGGRDDVPRFLAAADLLIHPAVTENTGNVIVEALVAGCAVLATGACGYGFHVRAAKAGCIANEPFEQDELNQLLIKMLDWHKLRTWGEQGFAYADRVDLYSRPKVAVEIIIAQIQRKKQEASSV
jgi:UDP-glucose:(heptosyl)LPS alpha-1,3-glucosyltransferase